MAKLVNKEVKKKSNAKEDFQKTIYEQWKTKQGKQFLSELLEFTCLFSTGMVSYDSQHLLGMQDIGRQIVIAIRNGYVREHGKNGEVYKHDIACLSDIYNSSLYPRLDAREHFRNDSEQWCKMISLLLLMTGLMTPQFGKDAKEERAKGARSVGKFILKSINEEVEDGE